MLSSGVLLAPLKLAALVGLVSLGFNLMYGVLRFLNLAHGEVVVLGALVIERLARAIGLAYALPLGILIVSVVGIVIGRLLFQPLRLQPRGAMLATSLGLAILLQVFISGFNKQAGISLRPGGEMAGAFDWRNPFLLMGLCLAATALLQVWLTATRFGQAVVVAAENPDLAEAWGLPVQFVFDSIFAASFGLAALSGGLLAIHYSVSFGFAFKVLIWSFAAILVGGLGKPVGGVIASLIVASLWFLLGRIGLEPFVDAALLMLAAISYILLPEGILGQRVRLV